MVIPKIKWEERTEHLTILDPMFYKNELTIFPNAEIGVNAEKTNKNQSF